MMKIASEAFRFGSIQRKHYQRYVKRYLYRYRGVNADLVNGNEFIVDEMMDELADEGVISLRELLAYYQKLTKYMRTLPEMREETDEEIYREILRIREIYHTAEVNRYLKEKKKEILIRDWRPKNGIDQIQTFWNDKNQPSRVTLMVMDAELLASSMEVYRFCKLFRIPVRIMVQNGQWVDTLVGESDLMAFEELEEVDLVTVSSGSYGFDLTSIEAIDKQEIVIGFGEWFVGVFRNLNVDAHIVCQSKEILTRAVTNAIDKKETHWIYIPAGFDLIQSVSIVERSLMNYRVLSWIAEKEGNEIYQLSAEELINHYPSYFLHGNSDQKCSLPFTTGKTQSEQDFFDKRNCGIFEWIQDNADDVEMGAKTIFDRNGYPMKVTYAKLQRLQDHHPRVFSTSKAQEIRPFFREKKIEHGLAMNFLFFATEKSIATYNQMRKKRPLEQIHNAGWHIDYRKNDDGETFPLYAKAAVGMDDEGKLHFFRKQLGAGELVLNGISLKWDSDQVDPELPEDFCIFTPYAVKTDTEAYLDTRELVGQGRVNLVVVNDRIVAIRKGGVILPNIGVVLSFSKENWIRLFAGQEFDGEGYGEAERFAFSLRLDTAANYHWVYGGAMFLVYQGEAFDTEEKLMAEFRREGWLSDLSKQTQDSETFRLEKHPRSMIGMTKSGEYFMAVVSGRSRYSVGADYLDLIQIAEDLFDDVEMLMNVDGGASSFMGLIHHGEVLELSDVTFTNDSSAGTLRPLNSIFTITYQK